MKKNNNQEKINQQIIKMIDQKIICGASWGIISHEVSQMHYHGVLGVTNQFKKIAVSKEAVYDLASLTKVIGTTTRILQLIDQAKLTWNTEVASILLEFPTLKCNIVQLLTHTSGLPADFVDKSEFSFEKLERYLNNCSLTNQIQPVQYSDIGFLILGLIIEKVDQVDLENSFQQHIFKPLKMNNTSYYSKKGQLIIPTEIQKNGEAIVGVPHDSKARNLNRPIGSAGLFSDLSDVMSYTSAIMKNQINQQELFFSSMLYHKIIELNEQGRTLGWEWFQSSALYHTGFTGTSIGIDVKHDKALILLTNRVHPSRDNPTFITKRKQLYSDFFKECKND